MVPEVSLHDVLLQVRALSDSDRAQLLESLKQFGARPASLPRGSARGKMAHLPNTSEDFIRRKAEEIDLEERRFSK
jgi:hypothetical protein